MTIYVYIWQFGNKVGHEWSNDSERLLELMAFDINRDAKIIHTGKFELNHMALNESSIGEQVREYVRVEMAKRGN